MAAGAFPTIEAAQDQLCPGFQTIEPEPVQANASQKLFALYRKLYFAFGQRTSSGVEMGDVLPELRRIAAEARGGKSARSVAN